MQCIKALKSIIIINTLNICLAEQRKHQANDPKWHTLGWNCTPLAVGVIGTGVLNRQAFSHLASRLSFGLGYHDLVDLYGRLNVALQCKSSPM